MSEGQMQGRAERAVRAAAEIVGREAGMSAREVLAARGFVAKRARRTALYLAVTEAGLPVRQVSRVTGLARSGLQRALAQFEDRRDEPAFDARLTRLGRKFARAAA